MRTLLGWVFRIFRVVVFCCIYRGHSIQNKVDIVEMGRCIHGVVVFNWSLCSLWYRY